MPVCGFFAVGKGCRLAGGAEVCFLMADRAGAGKSACVMDAVCAPCRFEAGEQGRVRTGGTSGGLAHPVSGFALLLKGGERFFPRQTMRRPGKKPGLWCAGSMAAVSVGKAGSLMRAGKRFCPVYDRFRHRERHQFGVSRGSACCAASFMRSNADCHIST